MKARIYWILLTSLVPATAFSQTINLDSSNSFHGENGGTFTPNDTSNPTGTVYIFNGDMCICDAGKDTPLTGPCFEEDKGALYFVGNNHELMFENINATASATTASNAGAIAVTTSPNLLELMNFSSLNFINAGGGDATTPNKAGAVSSSGMTTLMNNNNITFTSCVSSDSGGAIHCEGCMLSDSSGKVLFDANQGSKGGAIYSGAVVGISGNNQVMFNSNQASTQGGAIDGADDIKVAGNNQVVFSNNKVTDTTNGKGGAIYCPTDKTITVEKNQAVLFDSNTAVVSGGAIEADKLVLSSKGEIKFINNKATGTGGKGGAINTSTDCTLSADSGNIIFDGNTIKSGANEQRNAINANGSIMALRAKQGSGIFFYDPIISKVATALEINKPDAQLGQFTGEIVFSGETLTEAEKATAGNYTSTFAGDVTLSAGTLHIKSAAYVKTKTFTQTKGSVVVMDVGTTLESDTTNTTGNVVLEDLAINVASLGENEGSLPVAITSGKDVTLNNVDIIATSDTDYEYTLFGKDISLNVVQVTGNTNSPTLPTEISITPAQHYGYQGSWKIPKVTLAQGTTTATLAAQWTYSGYIPHPERRGGLVPNTLWGAFSDMRVIQKVMKNSASHELSRQGIWGAGLGSFLRTSSSGIARQFSHSSGGYLLGVTGKPMLEDIFSLGFYQMFGKDKDYSVMKNHSTMIGGAMYYQHGIATELSEKFAKMFHSHDPMVVHVQFSYNHAKHDEKTTVTPSVAPNLSSPITMNGSWGNDCFGVEVGSFVTVDLRDSYFLKWFDQCHPFIRCQFVYAHQEDFEEDNALNGRTFESSFLSNLSIPMGVILEKRANHDGGYSLSITYSPDAYRENPKTKMFLLSDPKAAYWETKATNLARQSLIVTLGQHFVANSRLEFFANGGFEIRGSSRSYNVDIRGQAKF